MLCCNDAIILKQYFYFYMIQLTKCKASIIIMKWQPFTYYVLSSFLFQEGKGRISKDIAASLQFIDFFFLQLFSLNLKRESKDFLHSLWEESLANILLMENRREIFSYIQLFTSLNRYLDIRVKITLKGWSLIWEVFFYMVCFILKADVLNKILIKLYHPSFCSSCNPTGACRIGNTAVQPTLPSTVRKLFLKSWSNVFSGQYPLINSLWTNFNFHLVFNEMPGKILSSVLEG